MITGILKFIRFKASIKSVIKNRKSNFFYLENGKLNSHINFTTTKSWPELIPGGNFNRRKNFISSNS